MTMTKGRLRAEHPAVVWAGAGLRGAGHLLGWPIQFLRNRRLVASLACLGEAGLRDIGLSGQDVRDARALLFAEDPSALLNRRAAERRRAAFARRAMRDGM